MFKFIRDWQDRRLKKRMERIFCSYVLDCDIDVKGCVSALGAKEIAWWRINGKKKPLPLEWQEGITPKMIRDDINHKNKIKMKKYFVALGWLAAYAVGLVGGVGYAAYSGAWVIAICVILLGIMAFPKVKEAFKMLSNN